jgi:(p)ppGpp synthase/HD superfamily hydrolase
LQVVRAAEFAATAHAGQVRRTGEAYVTHAVETACIIAGLVPSSSPRSVAAVVAALLHDVVDDTATTLEDVSAAFGAEVASLVDGVTRLSQLNQLLRRHRRLEMVEGAWATPGPAPSDASPAASSGGLAPSDGATLRALILSMVDDPRVVLLKLADRQAKQRCVAGCALGT